MCISHESACTLESCDQRGHDALAVRPYISSRALFQLLQQYWSTSTAVFIALLSSLYLTVFAHFLLHLSLSAYSYFLIFLINFIRVNFNIIINTKGSCSIVSFLIFLTCTLLILPCHHFIHSNSSGLLILSKINPFFVVFFLPLGLHHHYVFPAELAG